MFEELTPVVLPPLPTIAQLLADRSRPSFSFEFSPPRGDAGFEQLARTILDLDPLGPDFISITYGASGSTRDRTIAATQFVKRYSQARTMGHLTCVSQSEAEVRAALEAYTRAGINHILAVRGDPPGGPGTPWVRHPDGLNNATELVRLVKDAGDFCVGVAAFPDAHPERSDFDLDARVLVAKEQAGAEFAITQLFFDADAYFRLVDRVRALGSDLPIVAGIMPITNVAQVERFATLSGAPLPDRVASRLRAVADDPAAVRTVGVEIMTELCERLLAGGAPGLQFFTLNRSRAAAEILGRLRGLTPAR